MHVIQTDLTLPPDATTICDPPIIGQSSDTDDKLEQRVDVASARNSMRINQGRSGRQNKKMTEYVLLPDNFLMEEK